MDGADILQTAGVLASVAGGLGGYYAWRALDDSTVRKSQDRFRAVRVDLRESLFRLSEIAADLHASRSAELERIGPSTLLSDGTMQLATPLPLNKIQLLWEDAPRPKDDVIRAALHKSLPLRTRWSRYASYSQALEALMRPAMYENRQSFRLLRADWLNPSGPVLTFGPGYYFDTIDEGEGLVSL